MSNNLNQTTMNNEETIIIQPQNAGATEKKSQSQNSETTEQKTVNNTADVKEKKESGSAKRVAATAAAGVFGGVAGGVGTATAANMMNAEEPEVEVEEEVQDAEPATAQAAHTTSAHDPKPVTQDEEGNPDYTGHAGANPVTEEPQPIVGPQPTEEPQPTPTDNGDGSDSNEVQVLGVYQRTDENGVQQEMAILTNGEEVAAVVDTTGDGEVNFLAVDENHNGQFEEGEIYDVSNEHASMDMYEQAYVAQHPEISEEQQMMAAQEQMEMEQQETFAYEATDDSDYNNEAPIYDA